MATKRKKSESEGAGWMSRIRAYMSERSPEAKARGWRRAAACAIVLALAGGGAYGLGRLENYVHAMPRYDRVLAMEWVDLPDWLRLEENRHILDSLARRVSPGQADRLLDEGLAERLGRALADGQSGWVKSVDRVTIRPDGIVTVRCTFRRPAAFVKKGSRLYLVDAEGWRLPGEYKASEAAGSNLLVLDEVDVRPPAVGTPWDGLDVAAGLRLAGMLESSSFRHQVRAILLGNYNGARDRSRPQIELTTDRPGARIWWGRAPGEENGTEITSAQKLSLLETLYRQWGRIDMNRAYVNIMTWPDRVALPAGAKSEDGRVVRG